MQPVHAGRELPLACTADTPCCCPWRSAALHAQSLPRLAVPDEAGSATPLSPLSSTTPLSCTPSEAVPMPRRKFPKQQDDVAASLESEVRLSWRLVTSTRR